MDSKALLEFLHLAEKLKCEMRHSWTSTMRQESVAEHSWRLCVFSWLLRKEMPDYDMDKVMLMCLFHDLGEAVAGDIPSFNKSDEDEKNEEVAVRQILCMLDEDMKKELEQLFAEMWKQETKEAKLFKALDKLEAVIQHNEAHIDTWIELEYELNKTYGNENVKDIKVLEELREEIRNNTLEKIADIKKPGCEENYEKP